MHFQPRKLADRKSIILVACCAVTHGIGCSSRVELGVDSQFDASAGGASSIGTQLVNLGGSSVASGGGSFVLGTGGTYLVGAAYATGGKSANDSTTRVLIAIGGASSTGRPATGSSGAGCMAVSNGYVTTNEFAGYAYTYATQSAVVGASPVTISPSCDTAGCSPAFPSNAVCATGNVGAASDYGSSAGITFNVNQPNANDPYTSLFTTSLGSYGLEVNFTNTAGSPLRVQLKDSAWITYCYELPPASGTSYIPWNRFNTACWDNSGTEFLPSVPIVGIQMMVPGDSVADVPFDFCLLCVQTFSGLQ